MFDSQEAERLESEYAVPMDMKGEMVLMASTVTER